MKVRIEIDTKTFVRFWLVVMGFGLAGLAIYSAKDGAGFTGNFPVLGVGVESSGCGNC